MGFGRPFKQGYRAISGAAGHGGHAIAGAAVHVAGFVHQAIP